MKKTIFLLIAACLLVSGCTTSDTKTSEPTCQDCPDALSWSKCDKEMRKARTNYKCNAQTNYACEKYEEEVQCKTELSLKGQKGLSSKISPTIENTVQGVITVEALKIPKSTDFVVFMMLPNEISFTPNMSAADLAKIVRHEDNDGTDGWKALFDTTKIKNGIYKINVLPTYVGAPDEEPWIDHTTTQVVVNN